MTENKYPQEMKNEEKQTKESRLLEIIGVQYEIKLSMLFLLQGMVKEEIHSFHLAANFDEVGCFDDLVFKYTCNGKTSVIFLQAKHGKRKSINFDCLLSPSKKDNFSLRKYLNSYKQIKQRFQKNELPIFENGLNDYYYTFTNATFDFNDCEEYFEKGRIEEESILDNLIDAAECFSKKGIDKVKTALINSRDKPSFTGSEIEEFLKKFRMFGGEKKLEEIIIKTIQSGYLVNQEEANLIYSDVYQKVETWWLSNFRKTKKGFLTKTNNFFESGIHNIFEMNLACLVSVRKAQIKAQQIIFENEHVKEIMELIEDKQILNISTANTTITCAKVYQALESITKYQSQGNFDYKYILLDSIIGIKNRVILGSIKNENTYLLVFEYKSTEDKLQELYEGLYNIIKDDCNKKIIIIVEANKIDTEFENKFSELNYKKFTDETKNLLNLTKDSKNQQINQGVATFQGETVSLGKLLDENTRKFVDEEILTKLVNNSRITIGKNLINLDEIKEYYINRKFSRRVKVKADFQNDTSRFFVQYNSEFIEERIKDNSDIVLISNDTDDFYKICNNYDTNNIHWLEEVNREFIWRQSRGFLSNLHNFIDTEIGYTVNEEDMIKIKDKVVIICAEPGMGQSAALINLAQNIKKSNPFFWVETINLNDHTDYLENMDLNQAKKEEAVIEVLSDIVKPNPGLDTELFKHRIKDEGKVVFLFDGFDEISPTYHNKVVELLNILKETKADNLWVTTRPHLRNTLEDKFGVISYSLEPITKEDQIMFLKKFWNAKLGLNIGDGELNKYINDTELTLTGVPLQIRMVSEMFQDEFYRFYESKESARINVVDLYQQFINKKMLLYIKGIDNLTEFKNFDKSHKLLAINSIFHDDLPKFLSGKERNYLNEVKDVFKGRKEKNQIVQIINGEPIFLHRIFAEYFSALWFAEKLEENNKEIKDFVNQDNFKEEYKILNIFLDKILTGLG